MKMAKVILASLVCFMCLFSAAFGAWNIGLATDDPLVFDAATVSSPMLAIIYSEDGQTGDQQGQDLLSGWQTSLLIEPDPTATGTVQFNSAVQPVPYVFDGVGPTQGFSRTVSGLSLLALDALFAPTGVAVPTQSAGGANIIEMNFVASADASGLFRVLAEPALSSVWTDSGVRDQGDSFIVDPADIPFSNIGSDGEPVEIGFLEVRATQGPVIPEPHSVLVWTVVGVMGFAIFRRRRAHRG